MTRTHLALTTLAALTLAAALPQAAHAQSIGVSFGSSAANGQDVTTLAPTDVAGAPGFAQANYNNANTLMGRACKTASGRPPPPRILSAPQEQEAVLCSEITPPPPPAPTSGS